MTETRTRPSTNEAEQRALGRKLILQNLSNGTDEQLAARFGVPVDQVTLVRNIATMHGQEMNLSAMSGVLKLSRERIRQLIDELGLPSRLEMIRRRNEAIIRDAEKPMEELATKHGISVPMVALVLRRAGKSQEAKRVEERNARIQEAIKLVAEGMSIRAAAIKCDIAVTTLSTHLDETDVKSAYGRWGALDHRKEVIEDMLARGEGTDQILKRLEEIEKRSVRFESLKIWAREHLGITLPSPGDEPVAAE